MELVTTITIKSFGVCLRATVFVYKVTTKGTKQKVLDTVGKRVVTLLEVVTVMLVKQVSVYLIDKVVSSITGVKILTTPLVSSKSSKVVTNFLIEDVIGSTLDCWEDSNRDSSIGVLVKD